MKVDRDKNRTKVSSWCHRAETVRFVAATPLKSTYLKSLIVITGFCFLQKIFCIVEKDLIFEGVFFQECGQQVATLLRGFSSFNELTWKSVKHTCCFKQRKKRFCLPRNKNVLISYSPTKECVNVSEVYHCRISVNNRRRPEACSFFLFTHPK